MNITIDIDRHGPLFDGRADHEIDQMLHDARQQVAQQGLANWQQYLDRSIKHPTPYYETQVNIAEHGDEFLINDRDIVYGPWLEGVGSRNFPRTRFKGYASLRKAFALLETQAGMLIARVVARFIEEMNH